MMVKMDMSLLNLEDSESKIVFTGSHHCTEMSGDDDDDFYASLCSPPTLGLSGECPTCPLLHITEIFITLMRMEGRRNKGSN